jgi:hypothetical protein
VLDRDGARVGNGREVVEEILEGGLGGREEVGDDVEVELGGDGFE